MKNTKFVFWGIISIMMLSSFVNAYKEVYICKGPYSTKYHLVKTCKGLKNCSTQVHSTTREEAIKKKRTLCGYEK